MIKRIKHLLIASAVTALLAGCSTTRYSASGKEKIYDESADGAAKQIATALGSAQKEQKRVLLQFGANWSEGCHKLHDMLKTDPAVSQHLKNDYVWVLIDLDQGNNAATAEKYGDPAFQGYPALVVLGTDGQQLLKTDTTDLKVGDDFSAEKVTAFLRQWAPKR